MTIKSKLNATLKFLFRVSIGYRRFYQRGLESCWNANSKQGWEGRVGGLGQ